MESFIFLKVLEQTKLFSSDILTEYNYSEDK